MMQLVGIRDLKNKLTHYLEIAKGGHAIIITDRGVPVAVLHNLDQIEEDAGFEERLAYLAARGFVTLPGKAGEPAFAPVERAEVKGGPVSETIIRERR
ncbi:MAG: type II toxin-antitoxin system prevent-host-death family antitoxin [Syntrophobacteraceae bacterium]|jgi:prevent-host-death family protein